MVTMGRRMALIMVDCQPIIKCKKMSKTQAEMQATKGGGTAAKG